MNIKTMIVCRILTSGSLGGISSEIKKIVGIVFSYDETVGAQASQIKDITVLSFNILAHCWKDQRVVESKKASHSYLDVNQRYLQCAKQIETQSADIVFLQEVTELARGIFIKSPGLATKYDFSPISRNQPTSAKDDDGKEVLNGTMAMTKKNLDLGKSTRLELFDDMGAVTVEHNGILFVGIHLDWFESGTDHRSKGPIRMINQLIDSRVIGFRDAVVFGDWNQTREQMHSRDEKSPLAALNGKIVYNDLDTCMPWPNGLSTGGASMQLDHAVSITNKAIITLEYTDSERVIVERICGLSKQDPEEALAESQRHWGSDHTPVRFRVRFVS